MKIFDKNNPIRTRVYLCIAIILVFVISMSIYSYVNDEVKFSINKPPYTVPLDSPSSGFIAKLNDTLSVSEMVKCLSEVKNDSDLILLSKYINSENASAFCKEFKNLYDRKKRSFKRNRQNTVAEFINKDLDIGPVGKHKFIVNLVSNLQKDHDELATQVSHYLYFVYDSEYAFSPEEILQQISPKALFKTMKAFEQLSSKNGPPNFTLDESRRGARSVNRPGTYWSLTLMQSLVNCMRYSPEEKRASLRIILSKAIDEAPNWWDNEEEVQELIDISNLAIDKLVFDENCEVNILDITVYDLIGDHTMFIGKTINDRDKVLKRFKKENKLL